MSDFIGLIAQSRAILQKHRELARISGLNFNIFTVLERERSEIRHSRLIADLLNPCGSHDQKSLYLKCFLESIAAILVFQNRKLDFCVDDFAKSAIVKTEESTSNGILDITIENSNFYIVIENKIDAKDQENQMSRYWSIANKKEKAFCIIYLTKFGSEPSPQSTDKLAIDKFVLLSYSNHILRWIDQCINFSSRLPLVREVLVQYEKLLRKMTNQNQEGVEMEMVDLLLKEDNFAASVAIAEALPDAKATVELKFWKALFGRLESKFDELHFEDFALESDNEIKSQIKNRYKYGYCPISPYLKISEKEWLKLGVGTDGHNGQLYVHIQYVVDTNGEVIAGRKDLRYKEIIEKLDNFGNGNGYVYYGESLDLYTNDGVLRLLDKNYFDDAVNSAYAGAIIHLEKIVNLAKNIE